VATPPPLTPKRAAVQTSLLEATEAMLGEGLSYADLNVERIATRAGISRTAFYFYFRDKRELLMRLAEEVTQILYEEADRWWSGEGDGPAALAGALHKVAGVYRRHGALLRAIVDAASYDPEVAEFWRGVVGRFVEATCERLEADRRLGTGPEMRESARGTAFALTWMTERTFYQATVQPDAVTEAQLVEGLVAVWTRTVYG
jgi:AcrR family transcriptional regulator